MKGRSKAGKTLKRHGRKRVTPQRRTSAKASRRRRNEPTGRETEIARLTRERDEARDQQTATSEVLRVISSSQGELEPVFRSVLENATRICDAKFGNIYRWDGENLHLIAAHNTPPAFAEFRRNTPFRPSPNIPTGRMVATKAVTHVADLAAEPGYTERDPQFIAGIELGGIRTLLSIPMLKDDRLIGALTIYRSEVRPFTEKQIALAQSFANQAVIAIENARLLAKLRQRTDDLTEALEQQTATSQVLGVISSSPGELEPVFEAILENAVRICQARFGVLNLHENGRLRMGAMHNVPAAFADFLHERRNGYSPIPGSLLDRVMKTREIGHSSDNAAEATGRAARLGGARSIVAVPMIKNDMLIGTITIYRQEVRPFTAKQIELLKSFAAQAVIAIENARLLNELRESLQQQTATAEVLRVVSSSPGDLQPVFQTMLENAVRICDAKFGNMLLRVDDDVFRFAAGVGVPPALADFHRQNEPFSPTPGSPLATSIQTKRVSHVADGAAEALLSPPARLAGARTMLSVPMLKDGIFSGAIVIYRQEVRPFSEKQIKLVENFAAQAVIAIENARLLNELRQRTDDLGEALQQQTATAEVLKVIAGTQGELQPVFETMLAKATELCGASYGALWLRVDDGFRYAALHGDLPQIWIDHLRNGTVIRVRPDVPLARLMQTLRPVSVTDMRTDASYLNGDPLPVSGVDIGGIRTLVVVPMIRNNDLVGAIAIYRKEVRPFAEKQIELVSNFAAQAVIAIENTRLLNELRQRTDDLTELLEQQTATSQVLQVISSSPGELEPVFHAMLQSAVRICEASFGSMLLREGDAYRRVALHNAPGRFAKFNSDASLLRRGIAPSVDRVFDTKQTSHILDIAAENPNEPIAQFAGARTLLVVPMLQHNEAIGALGIYRQDVRAFSDRQIELVTNFAAQAVIAIENTRLLNELRQSLEQQTATSEVLSVISSSTGELEPVFETLLANAVRICGAKFGMLFLPEGDNGHRIVAFHGAPPAFVESRRREPVIRLNPATTLGRVAATKQVVQVEDIRADPAYTSDPTRSALLDLSGARTMLNVPMLKDDELVGQIAIYRQEVRPFSEKQIALLQNFAAQAVIAIENTRLLNELRNSLQQQTATADVLKVISRSTFDLQPVFDSMAESAVRLCEAERAYIFRFDGEVLRAVASFNAGPENQDWVYRNPIPLGRHSVSARAGLERRTVQVADVQTDPEYHYVARDVDLIRTTLAVPMLKGDELIGTITIYRLEVKPFTENQIALMETFADQAVIAVENVRLFEAEQQRTRELAKSLEDLRSAQDRLVQTQKLASLGQLTAGIAHEIKNPLNFVNNFSGVSVELIEELRQALAGTSLDEKTHTEIVELTDSLRDNLDKIAQHGKRANSIVKNMLLHSREGSGEHRPVDINSLVEESLNLAYHGARAEKQGFAITIERSFDPTAGEVDVYPQEITRVFLNLISNSFYAATQRKGQPDSDGYEPTLTASTRYLGDQVEIRIRDNGTGISAEVKEKIFNPFFTTKPTGEGTGLGLSISHDIIVKQHAGTIEVDTQPGEFTEIRIILPRTGPT